MFKKPSKLKETRKAQTAIEYMLLLAVVVAIVLIGFRNWLPMTHAAANLYFNNVSQGILGMAPRCGNGQLDFGETPERCCEDAGVCFEPI